jgi:hypothetical protein
MTIINPPLSPSINQLYEAPNGAVYIWDGVKWSVQVASNAGVQLGSSTQAGIVKAGTNVSIDSGGALNVSTATNVTPGVVTAGTNVSIDGGALSVATATDTTLGVVKAGTNVHIDEAGALNLDLPPGSVISKVTDIPDVNSTAGGAALNDGSLLVYNESNERWDTINQLRADVMDGGFY